MSYPPVINDAATFPAPPAVGVVQACPLSLNRCGIATFGLTGHPGNGTSFRAAPAAPLAAGAAGRYVFAPGVETFAVSWTLNGHARIEILKLELYRRGSLNPIWDKTMDYAAAGGILGAGSTQFNGDLQPATHAASVPASAVAINNHGGLPLFPRNILTAQHAPYKLVLRITRVQADTEVECAARWIYLDVIVHDLQLALGPVAWIPPAGAAPRSVRYRLHAAATHAHLSGQLLLDNLGTGAPAAVSLRLTANVFARSSQDFYTNTVFSGLRLLWDDGPTLPLQATLRIRQSNGTPAGAQAGAAALGNLGVMWDWICGNRPAHANATARAFIDHALAYKAGEWPHASSNCHADRGGKRGVGGADHFEALPAGTLPAAALPLTAVANRPWSAITMPVDDAASADGGKAGVLFKPSRIAGDTYSLRVYLAYPNNAAFDVPTAQALQSAAANTCSLASPTTMTVWHYVQIAAQWRKHAAVDTAALVWAEVVALLAQVCVELEPPALAAIQVIANADYQNAFNQVTAAIPPALRLALEPAGNQHANDYGIHFVDYAAFQLSVTNHLTAARAHFNALPALPDDGAFRVAQMTRLALVRPAGYREEDLLIPTRAQLAQTPAQLCTLLLSNLGITSADTYEEKCKAWCGGILTKICGSHMRAVSPNVPGIHLYHFEFNDNWLHYTDSAEAATSVSNRAACLECAQATPADPPPMYWPAGMNNRICSNAPCEFRFDDSALVVASVPFRYLQGVEDGPAAAFPRMMRAKLRAARMVGARASIPIAHEIGHQLGMPHAGPHAHLGPFTVQTTGGIYPVFHDAADQTCIMSYNFTEAPHLHFCGLCSLRIAGWSAGPSLATRLIDMRHDRDTFRLLSDGAQNRVPKPALLAAWDAAAANCHQPGCGAAFGPHLQRQNCRLCGHAVCDAHSQGRRSVQNPLKAQPTITNERVCDQCYAVVVHPPAVARPTRFAFWQPDENAYGCHTPGCRAVFSKMTWKHHCRMCGEVFCDAHTSHRRQVGDALAAAVPVSTERVCDTCNALYA